MYEKYLNNYQVNELSLKIDSAENIDESLIERRSAMLAELSFPSNVNSVHFIRKQMKDDSILEGIKGLESIKRLDGMVTHSSNLLYSVDLPNNNIIPLVKLIIRSGDNYYFKEKTNEFFIPNTSSYLVINAMQFFVDGIIKHLTDEGVRNGNVYGALFLGAKLEGCFYEMYFMVDVEKLFLYKSPWFSEAEFESKVPESYIDMWQYYLDNKDVYPSYQSDSQG